MEENNNVVSYDGETAEVPVQASQPRNLARVWWGLVLGAVLAGVSLAITIPTSGVSVTVFVIALFVFAFGASLTLEESSAREVMFWMCTKSISFPGLIWEFSIDGFLWLIGMKALFWLIGVIFGIIVAILGVILGIIVAPFTYPFNLISYIREGD